MHSVNVFGFHCIKDQLRLQGSNFYAGGEQHQMHIRSVCKFCSSFAFGNGVCFF